MARRKVVTVEMMKYERTPPKTPYLAWGKYAIRKLTTIAESPRLLAYRNCIAREMTGKKFANLKEVQETFKEIAKKCAEEAKKEEAKPKKK
ncbi:MAG: hypothetical protein QXK94_10550 [Candidatus Jordarchaeales archaeon]